MDGWWMVVVDGWFLSSLKIGQSRSIGKFSGKNELTTYYQTYFKLWDRENKTFLEVW